MALNDNASGVAPCSTDHSATGCGRNRHFGNATTAVGDFDLRLDSLTTVVESWRTAQQEYNEQLSRLFEAVEQFGEGVKLDFDPEDELVCTGGRIHRTSMSCRNSDVVGRKV